MAARPVNVGEDPSLVTILWQRRWVILACLVVGGIIGYGLSSLQSPRYTAESRVFLNSTGQFKPIADAAQNQDMQRYLLKQAAVMTTNQLMTALIEKAKLDMTIPELQNSLDVVAAADTDYISITATGSTALQAQTIANDLPAVYRDYMSNQVENQAKNAIESTGATTQQARVIQAAKAAYGDGVDNVDSAQLPQGPTSPQPLRDGLLLGLLCGLLGGAAALFRQQRLSQLAQPQQAASVLDAPLLAVVPRDAGLSGGADLARTDSSARQAFRMAAITLDYLRGPAPWSVLVTGAGHGVGATTTAFNIAAAVADQGLRVVILDIEDTSQPSQESYRPRVALDHLADGHVNVATVIERHPGTGAEFAVIRARVAPFADGQHAVDVRAILERLPDGTDVVIIDAPPLLTNADSFSLAGQVDAIIAVTDAATSLDTLADLQSRTDLTGGRIAGVIATELVHKRRGPAKVGKGGGRSGGGGGPAPIAPQHAPSMLPMSGPGGRDPRGDNDLPRFTNQGGFSNTGGPNQRL